MANNYTTVQGDTWDKIALITLGSEYLLPLLLEANSTYRTLLVFPGDITLTIPDIDTSDITDRPDWLENDDDESVIEDDVFIEDEES
jgi:hypothetical protein